MTDRLGVALTLLVLLAAMPARADTIFYGSVHVSVDYGHDGFADRRALSSNSSRIGLKGFEELTSGQRAVWRLEAGVDASGEEGTVSGRNRYVGLETNWGEVLAGVHETPFERVRDAVALFDATVGDARTLMGTGSDGINYFDVRARNMLLLTSPRLFNFVTARLLYSTGNHDGDTSVNGADDQRQDLTSASVHAKAGPVYGGLAYEHQSLAAGASNDLDGWRLGAWTRFGASRVGMLWESLDAGDDRAVSRQAWLLNFQYTLGQSDLGAQFARAGSYKGNSQSGAASLALGYTWHYTPATQVYAVLAHTDNDDNGRYGGPAEAHGDAWQAAAAGESVTVLSVGMGVRF